MGRVSTYENDGSISIEDKLTGTDFITGDFKNYPVGNLLSFFQNNLDFGAGGGNGDSAYDIWLAEGNVGTEQDFLDSLQGEQGIQGIQGIQGPEGPEGPAGAGGTLQQTVDLGSSTTTSIQYVDDAKVQLTNLSSFSPVLGSKFEVSINDSTSTGSMYPSLKYIKRSDASGSDSTIVDYNFLEHDLGVGKTAAYSRAQFNEVRSKGEGVVGQLIGVNNNVKMRSENTSGDDVTLVSANENVVQIGTLDGLSPFSSRVEDVVGVRADISVDIPSGTVGGVFGLYSELDMYNGSVVEEWSGLTVDVTQTVGEGTIQSGQFIHIDKGIDEAMGQANGIFAINSEVDLPSFFRGDLQLGDGTNKAVITNGGAQTGDITLTLPDSSGTIALTGIDNNFSSDQTVNGKIIFSDDSSYVEVNSDDALYLYGESYTKLESSDGAYIEISDVIDVGPIFQIKDGVTSSTLGISNLTQGRQHELPDADGTIALTSDITTVTADQETADFNAAAAQVGLMVDVNSATDVVVTVQDFATEAIPVGSVLTYRQAGVGKISNAYSVATGDTSTTYREGDVLTLWHKTQDNWVVINPPHAIDSQTAGEPTGSDQVLNVVSLTQAEYDAAVGSHNADTLYVITS